MPARDERLFNRASRGWSLRAQANRRVCLLTWLLAIVTIQPRQSRVEPASASEQACLLVAIKPR